MERYFNRIDKLENNNFFNLAEHVCALYCLGVLFSVDIIQIGYEDFNAIICTEKGRFVVKVFNNSRSDQEALDCLNRTNIGSKPGMGVPKIFSNKYGEFLSIITMSQSRFRLLLMEYIEGDNFHQLGIKPNLDELDFIVQIACRISKIDYKPPLIYDKWAIMNFTREFIENRKFLNSQQFAQIEPVYTRFRDFDLDSLPKAFVHGDITSTNIIKDKSNGLWLVDFSVANYMARITEIIVICSDLAYIIGDKRLSEQRITHCFDLWCAEVNATEKEHDSFFLLFSVANAINVLNTAIEFIRGNSSAENVMHMNQGLWGLSLFS